MEKKLRFRIFVRQHSTLVTADVVYSDEEGITMTISNPTPDFPDTVEPALEQYINDNINILTPNIDHDMVFDGDMLPRFENNLDRLEQKRIQITTVLTRAIVTEVIVPRDFELNDEKIESLSMDIAMQCAVDDDREYLQKSCLDGTAFESAKISIIEQEIVGEVTTTQAKIN